MTMVGIPIGKAADFAYYSILRTQFDYERLRDTFRLSCAMGNFKWPNKIKTFRVNLVGYMYNLGVSPSLVSRYCEGYRFWST